MRRQALSPEILAIRGIIDLAGAFTPRRCYSTRFVRVWPSTEESRYVLELVDEGDRVLHRERALVTPEVECSPGAPRTWKVAGYIGLLEGASRVQLLGDGITLWRRDIPPAPELAVRLSARRASRERPLTLQVKHTQPGDGAFVQVVYEWGPRQFVVLTYAKPQRAITIDPAGLPGGRRCRFVVQYSNGLRSAGAATERFSLAPLGPTVKIASPRPGTILLPGQPLQLAGHVLDPERPDGPQLSRDLGWWVDGRQVGRGPIAGVAVPSPGRHRITLRYESGDRRAPEVFAEVGVVVRRRSERGPAPADEWEDWSEWEDGGRWS